MQPKRHLVLSSLILIFAILLAACSPAATTQSEVYEEGKGADNFGGVAPSMAPISTVEVVAESRDSSAVEPADADRLVIKNATLSIAVSDVPGNLEAITALAERMGGFVVYSYLYQMTLDNGQELPRADITIRVPSERLTEALEEIKSGAGEVLTENVVGEDVTSDYTDLQSRLRNLEQAEAGLREIMDQATRTEDVLNVFNQLTYVTEQIEVIKGQIQYYEQSAAMSAISVSIVTEASVAPLNIGGWEPVGVARDALQALIDTVQVLLNMAIWLVLFLLPVGAIIILPLWLVVRWLRRRRVQSKAAPTPPQNPA